MELLTHNIGPVRLDTSGGRQRIVGNGTTIEFGIDPAGEFNWLAGGQSDLDLVEVAFPAFTITGDPSMADNLVISPRAAGPQPEPPVAPALKGFDGADRVTLESPTSGGTPQSTSFRAIIVPLDFTGPVGIVEPLEICVELLVIRTGEVVPFLFSDEEHRRVPRPAVYGSGSRRRPAREHDQSACHSGGP